MTLRFRLVLALVVLVTAGLALFGFATYSLYAHSQYQRLDDQVRNSVPLVTNQLLQSAGLASDRPGDGRDPGPGPGQGDGTGTSVPNGAPPGRPPIVVPPGTYAELRSGGTTVLSSIQVDNSAARPKLAASLTAPAGGRYFGTGSVTGSTRWRVLAMPRGPVPSQVVVVAVPQDEVLSSLHRLVLIETASALGLLLLLAAGSWLILRRDLRPLEEMATTARTIAAGDLTQRVATADDHTEVGQLGTALNTMLSEIEIAFQERDETEQRLRQFLADASHELRTPLTSIQGFAELFRLGSEQVHVNLDVIMRRIEEESRRMKTLVEDLLLLARLDQTRPTERAPVDLAVLAADACSDAVAAAPDRKVTLDAPEPVVILGDQDHLRQAIANLVSNAVRHTPAGTPIEVSAGFDQGAVEVAVRDHGPGLDEESLAHVFDRFWQADAARVGTGAGLGLSIVAAIANEHGGSATAANADGGGALFTLHLPLTSAAA